MVQGRENSAHMKGLAADIRCVGSNPRWEIMHALIQAGFERIGVYPTFIHVDQDHDKPQQVLWL
jgi:uncharacterized protein YcbK (DUF882 family)